MISKIIPLSLALPFVLISCSDSEINSSDIPEISQAIFVVPETYNYEPYNKYFTSNNFYVNTKEKIRIWGIYAINGEYIPTENSTEYYLTHKWTIDDDVVSGSYVYYSFDKPGVHKVSFETVDHLGDTLLSHANIYVSMPSAVSLQSPSDGYNQIDGENKDGVELSWNISGIDPWESSTCVLYAHYNKIDVWETPLGEMSCSESVLLMGELDLILDKNKGKDFSTENSTIYWGVRASIKNETGHIEYAYSEIFSFSTKLKNKGDAIIEVPIACMFNQFPEKSKLKGAFISSVGDTLASFSEVKGNTVISETLPAQSNVKIVVCDNGRTEFGCDSMTVDLAPSTKNITDTLFLIDKVQPNMKPLATEISTDDPIKFFILDNGSGVNVSKNQAIMNNDTLKTKFENNILTIPNTCKKDCKLYIYAEDYARNKVPEVYWKIEVNKKETFIKGPFAITEGSNNEL